ncbi:hypothetical protein M501DRAFT_268519 [Patellaria atrata CBS 101060]|uniref:Uncharacterized protein n=1 Tax=Patellaria atrata CBS 101060 TaxID=1346257 RepID=A0A9P4VM60_9PEZI|nr:hypothetical protein M501DRAFT_268519 [Patellaria atrata CBS 101060]
MRPLYATNHPPIAAILMRTSIYIPFGVSLTTLFIIMSLLFILERNKADTEISAVDGYIPVPGREDTTNGVSSEAVTESNNEAHLSHMTLSEDTCSLASPDIPIRTNRNRVTLAVGSLWLSLKSRAIEMNSLFDSAGARFCLAVVFFKKVGFSSEGFVFQYVSEKFDVALQKTA